MEAPSASRTGLKILGLCLVAAMTVSCSFDTSRLRASTSRPSDAAVEHTSVAEPDARSVSGETAAVPDVFSAAGGDNSAETGGDGIGGAAGANGADASAATGGAGGSSPTETGEASTIDGPMVMGGMDSNDAPLATGGTGAGGDTGTNDTGGSTNGVDVASSSGGSADVGANADTSSSGGGGGGSSAGGSGGPMDSGGSSGGGADASLTGGQTDTGGSGSGGATCSCLPISTIGITGPWGATYSNGTSGSVVTNGDDAFLTWLNSRGANCVVQNLDISGTNYLTAARLAPYQVIIVLDIYHTQADKNAFFKTKLTYTGYPQYPGNQRTIRTSEVNALGDWVNNGGGLMTITGTASTAAEMANPNLLLNQFGIAYSVTDVNVLPGNSPITTFSTSAPIASLITAGITTLRVGGAASIEGLAGGNLPNNSNTFSLYASGGPIGRSGTGAYAIGVAKIVGGTGRINVWGDETITYDFLWNTSAYQTQTYWSNVLAWLAQCP
jgi:hypothetical protein